MQDILLLPAGEGDPTSIFLPPDLGPLLSESPRPRTTFRRLPSLVDAARGVLRRSKSLTASERNALRTHNVYKQILEARMADADTYDDWKAAASQLDKLEHHENWKMNDHSDEYYNPDLITSRLYELENARVNCDIPEMLHLVRTALSRDFGGIGSASLYSHSHIGTKKLVERYVQASVDLVEALVSRSNITLPLGLSQRKILEELVLARKSFGRCALVLSGGSVYGMAHIGVLKALFENNLLPRIISGTSAGSIVASVVCTKKDEEIPDVLERFAHGNLAVFTDKDKPDSWFTHISRVVRNGVWHESKNLARVMQETFGDMTFQEAFNRTRRILNITVSSKPGLQLPSLLNYVTAPNVIIWSAVVASCSVPGIFESRPLLVKDVITGKNVPWDPAEQLWLDGSVDNDIPVQRLSEILNVNHFIVSQANPHIVVFVSKDEKRIAPDDCKVHSTTTHTEQLKELLYTIGWIGKSEAIFCLENLIETGIFKGSLGMLLKMLNQEYTADINILPRMSLWWGPYLIRNPTPEFMLEACRVGERATWPSLCRIENSLAVELALDRALHALRDRVAFSESQVNLRRLFTGYDTLGVQRDEEQLAPKHHRRGSGGSVQLSARRRLNREELETIMSEGHDSDPESDAPSLAVRRGMQGMNLSSMFEGQIPPYRGPIKQNSLQHLPISKSPSPSPTTLRKAEQGSMFSGHLAPFTRISDQETMADREDGDESPVLSMKLRRGSSPTCNSSTEIKAQRTSSGDADDGMSDPEPYERTGLFKPSVGAGRWSGTSSPQKSASSSKRSSVSGPAVMAVKPLQTREFGSSCECSIREVAHSRQISLVPKIRVPQINSSSEDSTDDPEPGLWD